MEKLLCVLDTVVYALKENPLFSHIKFIHSGRNKYVQKPVESFLVACGVQWEKLVPAQGLSGKLEFTVYAPSGESRRTLTELCESMARSIREAQSHRCFEEVSVEKASFDSNLNVWCRCITVKVGMYEISEEEISEDALLSISGKDIFGVTSFSLSCNRDFHRIKELLAGDMGDRIERDKEVVMTLKIKGLEDVLLPYKDREFDLCVKGANEEYMGCEVQKSILRLDSSYPEREYHILCSKGVKTG